ncbi:MAG: hypothetical protein CO065_16395 [Comamonadaceae bacterium CG_4_9_14_0_8_um_filter_57_21]|nr:MAG: hypothetical protein CO065_16395 [Comamonadaceae bacterium CG_4_9_14_0_8_um_filter_57_21]
MTLNKRKNIQLVMDAKYWKTSHDCAVARKQWLVMQMLQLIDGLIQHKAKLCNEFEQALTQSGQEQQQQLAQVNQEKVDLQAQIDTALADKNKFLSYRPGKAATMALPP